MASDEKDRDEVRTTVILTRDQADRIKASAKENRRGWTNELVLLAIRALDNRAPHPSGD